MTTSPQIAIVHIDSIPEEVFSEFVRTIATERLKLDIESRENGEIYAGLEWLIPTAAIIYIGKSYFDGFLTEMGKDHYNLLKAGFMTLREKLLGPAAPQMAVVSSAGKTSPNQPYSLVYSIMAEGNGNLRFKLLIQREVSEREYDEILNAFLGFLEAYHSHAPEAEFAANLEVPRASGGIVLLAFNLETKTLEAIDPIPRKP
ncbi:hypothetical protein [Immundisolibacter cernigliae]|uniref:Uncharacterized protein n=1 Tax=Immundisolibacter cernigliae TaxID=1810504 RepID=A0A1B1YQ85_9GAMM|nr:hypothetical protein [Immundisolibacter cernigliae]ANX02907.1 hypothetical protein PG2T_00975 [Immundisolibacter cernigliae]